MHSTLETFMVLPLIPVAGLAIGTGLVMREAWRRYALETAKSGGARLAYMKYQGGFYTSMTPYEAKLILGMIIGSLARISM